MTINFRNLVCLLVLLAACIVALPAQDIAQLIARFDTPSQIQWTRTYHGYWQQVHPVEITLGYDGTVYHGRMEIGKDGLAFDLEGYYDADKGVVLQEIARDGRTTGYLIVLLQEGRMQGHWWSVDFSRAATIFLRSDEVIEVRRFEPELLTFEGNAGTQRVYATIQREESDLLSGVCTIGSAEYLYRISGSCDDPACDRMTLAVFAPAGQVYDLRLVRQRGTAYRLHLTESERGHTSEGASSVTRRSPMRRMAYTSFAGSIDCVYPVTSIAVLDSWISAKVSTWNTTVRRHIDSLEHVLEVPGPDARLSVQASAWVDFTLLTAQLASGILTMFDPRTGTYAREAFIIDLKSGKHIAPDDLSRKARFSEELLQETADLKEPGDDDEDYLVWLDNQPLQHIALGLKGFVLFTDFDAQYGDTWVTVPYRHYAHLLRRNAPVFDLEIKTTN